MGCQSGWCRLCLFTLKTAFLFKAMGTRTVGTCTRLACCALIQAYLMFSAILECSRFWSAAILSMYSDLNWEFFFFNHAWNLALFSCLLSVSSWTRHNMRCVSCLKARPFLKLIVIIVIVKFGTLSTRTNQCL